MQPESQKSNQDLVQVLTSIAQALQGTSFRQPWQVPTLLNGWANYGGTATTVGYMKDSMGFVHLKGLVKSGTLGTNVFVLPPGYRPAAYNRVAVIASGTYGNLDIDASGNVLIASGSTTFTGLDGATFLAEN